MHIASVGFESDLTESVIRGPDKKLEFLWLELTNRCNLQCVHCYTESHPHSGDRDLLTAEDYESIMQQAYALGCRKIQFIGGEPQLNPSFLPLLIKAKNIGFEFIEVFTNLTRLEEETIRYAANHKIRFATSVYSDEPAVHDAITKVSASHTRTVSNLKKLIANGIETRAAIIVVNQDPAGVERTKRFLWDLGVPYIRHSETREFGRGEAILSQRARLSGLCGHCWAGKLCVAPDGVAYPCVMARQWPVGNVRAEPLATITQGKPLEDMRQTIFQTVWLPKVAGTRGGPDPTGKRRVAASKDCAPYGRSKDPDASPEIPETCKPADFQADDPCDPCPQSCVPIDGSTCGPHACPQSCDPFIVVCEPGGN
jgi:MoaA/NifB/PqqE/SkfB family radical SAM enzyme